MSLSRLSLVVVCLLAVATPVAAQGLATAAAPAPSATRTPDPLTIMGISVEGIEGERTRQFIIDQSGLEVGQTVTVPGDPAFAEAIRTIYKQGLFSDVKIVEERRAGNGVFIAIKVQPEPRLADYRFEGMKKGHRKKLAEEVPLLKGMPVRPGEVARAKQVVEEYFQEKGFLQAEANVEREVNDRGLLELVFTVDRGPRVEIGDVVIEGNEAISDRKIRKRLKNTKEDRWWRFWKSSRFDQRKYEEDLQAVLDYYNQRGFYDAQIVRDSVYLTNEETGEPELVVQLNVREGPQYHIRNVEWEGNTVYPDAVLTQSLGLERGDTYNSKKLEENLYANRRSTDVASLYTNRGHMRFNVQPTVTVVGDSLDLHFDVFEGEVYSFGEIDISGNTKTKEHVIRRELYTFPGQTYSRDAVMESIRRLSQLSYFNQESLAAGPGISIDDEAKVVDLTYNVEEVGGDQLELSGTWGRYGLILMLRLGFNNFSAQNLFNKSAWKPLPAGDGQKLSLGVQTNGSYYQSYSLSFTEPWFRGRPTPTGFALSFSKIGRNPLFQTSRGQLLTTSARLFYDQRLKWPDDKFNSSTGLRYQYFDNDGWSSFLPSDVSQEVTFQQAFSRNSLDNPSFPRSGSSLLFSVDVALPIPDFVQYHKWRFKTSWNMPLTEKISIGVGTDLGYIGSITGDDVQFERFIVGGSPFETQGINNGYFGSDIVLMRGYPAGALGPRFDSRPIGGRVLNKYTSELRWLAVQSQQLQAAPYLFLDAANTWDRLETYSPAQLYRSAGVGVRLFLPILGMLELTYGYNFDEFEQVSSSHTGEQRWYFQFSLGQGFN